MPKIMLHDEAARAALGRGVAKLAKAVRGTLGPKGMNAIMDRPIGTPIVSRDGVSIASEIELECPCENMGAQVLREVSKQTNEVAGDGTILDSDIAAIDPAELLQPSHEGANRLGTARRRAQQHADASHAFGRRRPGKHGRGRYGTDGCRQEVATPHRLTRS